MASSAKLLGTGLALGRIAIGAGLWIAPQPTARALGFDRVDTRALMLGRIAATRDLVLGIWQLASVGDPAALRRISAAAAAADAGDTLTFALAAAGAEERGAGVRGVAVALPAALAGWWVATQA